VTAALQITAILLICNVSQSHITHTPGLRGHLCSGAWRWKYKGGPHLEGLCQASRYASW